MASGPITSWEVDGETVETVSTVSDFIFLGSKKDRNGMTLAEAEDIKRGGKNTQKNCTKKINMTQIIMMVYSLTQSQTSRREQLRII